MHRATFSLGGLVSAVALLAGLSVVAPTAAGATPLPPPDSMAATGDSFTRGFATGAGTCNAFVACPEYSWSTGTAVDSHYQRLLVLNPALAGNAVNAAVPGAPISGLVGQIGTVAPAQPDYLTVLLGGGDICFGATTPAQFASHFRAGMDALFSASPDTRVLVGSIWDFESMRSAVLAANPSATFPFCASFFNAPPASRAATMSRVTDYNAVLAAECATYANCLFDGNALFDHVWTAAEVSTVDNFHPSAVGQAMISDVLYDAGYQWGIQGVQTKEQCKHGGWQTVTDDQGRPFRNQGQCVSYVTSNRPRG